VNYYEHHLGDYLRDTAHLSILEDGAYRRLLDAYYIREAPLPATMREVFRLVRAQSKQDREAVETVLREFFAETPDGWRHGRCDREIGRFQDKQRKARASANARWGTNQAHSEGNADAYANASPDAMRTHSEGNAPRARPQSPDTRPNSSEANASAGEPAPPSAKDRVFALGIPLLTAAGVVDRNARSMLGLMTKTHGADAVADAIDRCAHAQPVEPVAWLQAALKAPDHPAGRSGQLPKVRDIFAVNER
jgi:uncharacterized protein YdaU (DUF1376 family)